MFKDWAFITLLALAILSTNQISGADRSDTLFVKRDSVICSRIQEISSSTITIDDDRHVALAIISEIRTSDSTVVSRLKSFYPGITVTRLDSIFIIYTKDISILPSDKYYGNVVHRYFFIFDAMSAEAEGFEFQMNMVPRFSKILLFQVTASSGFGLGPGDLSINQISAGLGFIQHYVGISFTEVLNVGHKTLEKGNLGKESNDVVSLSLNGLIPIINDTWLLAVGSRIYFNNIPVNGNKTYVSFNIGVGYNIQITPD